LRAPALQRAKNTEISTFPTASLLRNLIRGDDMSLPHTPEFRKILWGGLVAWIIQGVVILTWSLGYARPSATPDAQAIETTGSVLIAGAPIGTPAIPIK
jgi:hypothetical protein